LDLCEPVPFMGDSAPDAVCASPPRTYFVCRSGASPTGPRKARPDDKLRMNPESRDSGFAALRRPGM